MSHKRGRDKKANEKREAIRLERRFIGDCAPFQFAIDSSNYQIAHMLEQFVVRVTKLHWFLNWRKYVRKSTQLTPCPKCGSSLLWADSLPVRCGNPDCDGGMMHG